MKTWLYQWIRMHSIILINAGSLVGTTAVTSLLGFAYWWLSAHRFPAEAVGIASASVSAMMLLASLCVLGLGTLLITELPRQPGQEARLISTALIVVGVVGGCIGGIFAIVAPFASTEFQMLRASAIDVIIFASGVGLTAITLVLDQALIGLLSGKLQLWRNTLFGVAKLVVLFVISFWLSHETGITIYATWTFGSAFSLVALAAFAIFKGKWSGRIYLPQWDLLRKLGPAALQHHLLNLTLQAPTLALPVLVTVLLSAKANAWFYISWMVAGFVFTGTSSLTVVLHAINSAQHSTLGQKARVTVSLALVTSVLANCVLLFGSKQVLGLFGSSYAEQATWCLRILGLAAFPVIIKNHYISICRIHDRIVSAMLGMLPGGLLELVAATIGAHFGGLSGLSLGWIVAIYIESMFMFRTVYKTVRFIDGSSQIFTKESSKTKPIWLMDTSILMSISQGYKIKAVKPLPIFLQTTKKESHLETELKNSKKYNEPNGAKEPNNIDRFRLKPVRLQPYVPSHDSKLLTDVCTNEQGFGE